MFFGIVLLYITRYVMDDYFLQLKEVYSDFYNEELDEEKFRKYINKLYFDILRGGFVDTDKLIIYPLLKMMLKLFDEDCDKSDIQDEKDYINDVFKGEKDIYFNVMITLPEELFERDPDDLMFDFQKRLLMDALYHKLKECESDFLRSQHIDLFMYEFNKFPKEKTIFEKLENRIIAILQSIYDDTFLGKSTLELYPSSNDETGIFNVLYEYLEFYLGIKSFPVLVKITKQRNGVLLLI